MSQEKTIGTEEVKKVENLVKKHQDKKGAAIPILQDIQKELGYIPKEVLPKVTSLTKIPESDLYSIVTFYSQFRLQPVGDNLIHVCHGTACHLAGAEEITNALVRELEIGDEGTSPDGKFTVEKVACLGCCSLAPVMTINGETHGRLTPDKAVKIAKNI
ncbi:NADH-quinone oxidoreductase subunit NuoE [Natranaerobius thermophilus]|uniref:NADH dehydrogenase (Ubiquinone) 24 kDa subunit n=1 Tax=Natranaerobius thermophilus (strain ATCC BAA-1301 / DSM 18059 / JW/NM-WN-LF) TaxID=457570 RepID=B2A225_NATTJ|nr:NADH-quinone oxidoreductase subunit NuoE [Natranaerobius thermophilus]ACB84830.1 NADH dehydrogenase (ubiquinone) 24 kDa subunit [Natranaerobius thermophilus JW/NM-WN-LF]